MPPLDWKGHLDAATPAIALDRGNHCDCGNQRTSRHHSVVALVVAGLLYAGGRQSGEKRQYNGPTMSITASGSLGGRKLEVRTEENEPLPPLQVLQDNSSRVLVELCLRQF